VCSLLQNRGATLPAAPTRYRCELLRNTERETVQLGLRETILSELKNTPQIEITRLEKQQRGRPTPTFRAVMRPGAADRLLLDGCSSALQVGIAHGAVEVHRGFADPLKPLEVE